MIVRIVTYGAKSLDAGRQWAARRAADVRSVEGVRRVEFIEQDEPPRVGGIFYLESRDDLARYKESGPYERFVEEMREHVIDSREPVRDQVFELLDV